MAITRRGFLKSFIAAASMAVARHYAPSALAAPRITAAPLSARELIERMDKALSMIRPGSRAVFWMAPATYDRLVRFTRDEAVRVGADKVNWMRGFFVFGCPVESIEGELDESGAIVELGQDGSRRVVDIENGEMLQHVQRQLVPHQLFPKGSAAGLDAARRLYR